MTSDDKLLPAPAKPLISIFLPSAGGGGAERICINLAVVFAAQGYRVDLVLSRASGAYLSSVPPEIRVVDLDAVRPLRAIPALVAYLRRARPFALLSSVTSANMAALMAIRIAGVETRHIVREASTLSVELAQGSRLNRWLVPRLMAWLGRRGQIHVAPSQAAAADLAATTGLPLAPMAVIYNPVISPALAEKAAQPCDHPWVQPGQVPVILGVGRLSQQKDFATLVAAFAMVRQTRAARLLILGEGELRPALEAQIAQLGLAEDVSLPGFVTNPYAYLARATVFVLSSRWEGLPGVLVEALACGAQVVATDCPSGPREILQDGVYGDLVPVGDAAAMAAAILKVLDGQGARPVDDVWRQAFSLAANARKYLALMNGEARTDGA